MQVQGWLNRLPVWAQHVVVIFVSTFFGSILQAILSARGVTDLSWPHEAVTALNAAAVATATGLAALWALPANAAYGLKGRHRGEHEDAGTAQLATLGVVLAAAMLLAACGPTPAVATSSASTSVPVGPVPPAVYTVQAFPPAGTCHYRWEGKYPLPDPKCTPGATNPQVTQTNLHTTVCLPDGPGKWKTNTKLIRRPPLSVTSAEKRLAAAAYGYRGNLSVSEGDHFVMEAGGGEPNDARNYWVEPPDDPNATSTANAKDQVEYKGYDLLCSGKLSLAALQTGMATDWVKFGHTLGVL